jgi:hypothetical protein
MGRNVGHESVAEPLVCGSSIYTEDLGAIAVKPSVGAPGGFLDHAKKTIKRGTMLKNLIENYPHLMVVTC